MTGDNKSTQREHLWVLDNMTTAALLFDVRKRLRFMNTASEILFSLSSRAATGMQARDLIQCPDNEVDTVLDRALATGQPFTEREMMLPAPGGRSITVDCTVVPLEEDGFDGILVEIQQVDRQLRISREEHFVSQYHASRALLRGMAHEIKNPLGGLRGAAQLLERELPDEELREYTRIIIEEADRLQTLIDRMLGPNRPPNKRQVNLHQLLERVRSLVEAEVGGGIELIRDYDPSIPLLHADPDQLIQAFLNIARNAAQALDSRGRILLRTRIHRQYTIGNRRHRLAARIDIEDNGPGIPEEMRESLFFPMVTGRPEGTGLGLSIAQSLIHQHGGLIECNSEPGATVFSIVIPLEMSDHD
ncbi:MAG: nitrogen regulation protein NR(II) [Chromatiales bacterium]|nr:nitrogen regulation protein NR(II) [Chromatiales bacterium]